MLSGRRVISNMLLDLHHKPAAQVDYSLRNCKENNESSKDIMLFLAVYYVVMLNLQGP
jgi:hypothetical protein